MSIKKSRKGWKGTEAADLDVYLSEFSASHGTPVSRVEHSACSACDSDVFKVGLDDEEGCAVRTCAKCGLVEPMLDSAEYLDDAELEDAACPCGHEEFQVAVGFALRVDGDVRWVFVSLRCMGDNTLGVYADWRIDYSPTDQLFARV